MDGHDPGGKVRHRLPLGMSSEATWGPDGRTGAFRISLTRRWSPRADALPMAIGMNPSTADEHANDPTLTRLCGFFQRWGFPGFRMFNVSAYRATDPRALVHAPHLDLPENREAILHHAATAPLVLVCCGSLPPLLVPIGRAIVAELLAARVPLHCLGFTQDGSPRHPLYIRNHTKPQPWMSWPP